MKDLSHIMMIEFKESIGGVEMPKVALFNLNHISQESVNTVIQSGRYNPDVVIMEKEQWEKLFQNI